MANKRLFCEMLQVRYSKLVCYTLCINPSFKRSKKQLLGQKNLMTSEKYSGQIKTGSKKRITKAVDLLLQLSPLKKIYNPITEKMQKFQLTFITLTIPFQTPFPDAKLLINRELKQFLRWIKEAKNCKHYVWKLEFQKNGMPHFHITTNEFIRHDEIKNKWNKILQSYGFLEQFRSTYGHYNPNSTDIHQVCNLMNIEAYLVKYLSKNEQADDNYKGKIWGCSDSLNSNNMFSTEANRFNHGITFRAAQNGLIEVFEGKNFAIFKPLNESVLHLLDDSQVKEYKQHIINLNL